MLAPTGVQDTSGHPCIPVISLLSDDVATKWDAAMRTVGFAVIIDHGVDPALQERVREMSKDWFTGMSDAHKEQRRRFRSPKYGLPGFSPLGAEAVGQTLTPAGPPPSAAGQEGQRKNVPSTGTPTVNNMIATKGTDDDTIAGVDQSTEAQSGGGMATAPSKDDTKQSSAGGMSDLVESFVMSSETQELPPSLESPLRAYWTEMTRVLRGVMELSALALGIDKHYFAPHFSSPSCALRCAHYPALHSLRAADMAGRERYGPHTDYTGFTLLGVDGEPGLQVLVNGMWIDVPYVEHGFIVNAGDLIPVYTNGLWRSNVHRVLAPAMDSPAAHRSRFSTVFFTGPSKESVVEPIAACVSDTCPRAFDPVRAGDWLKMKLNASHTS